MNRSRLETLVDIVTAGGRAVLEVYKGDFLVEFKGPGDPVTAADHRANALLLGRLREVFPGIPVIAEESDRATYERFWEAERMLFVDPLDGTREFIDRVDQFAVMIGLVEGTAAVMGVIHAPVAGVTWAGAVGLGAWQVDAEGQWTPVRVSPVDALARARIVVSRSHRSPRLGRRLRGHGRPDQAMGCLRRRRSGHGRGRPGVGRHRGADRLPGQDSGERARPRRVQRTRARSHRDAPSPRLTGNDRIARDRRGDRA